MGSILDILEIKVKDLYKYSFSKSDIDKNIPDHINNLLYDTIHELSSNEIIINKPTSSKVIEDIDIFYDGNNYKVDVKPYFINKPSTVSNLISIERARKYLKNEKNHIIYIFVKYAIYKEHIKITDIKIKPIESIDWSYLSIQNIGKGQLILKNIVEDIKFLKKPNRKEWFIKFIEKGKEYYDDLSIKVFEYKSNWIDNEKW
ncbi:MAG: hypothetical protein ACOC3Z_01195 [Nanoarchaeota archaeon]